MDMARPDRAALCATIRLVEPEGIVAFKRRAVVILPALVGLGVQALVWSRGGYDSAWDDMAITAAFARTFADTGRIALTPSSEIVEGMSTPLWLLILAACTRVFSLDAHALYRTAQALSSLLLDATLLLLGASVARVIQDRRDAAWALAGLCLLPLWSPFVHESVNGMENPLIALLLVGGAWWAAVKPAALAWVCVLLVWLRVEGGLLVLPLACLGLNRRTFQAVAAAASAAFLAQEAWRYATFGELVPNTVLAKLHEPYWPAGTVQAIVTDRILYLRDVVPTAFLPLALILGRRGTWTRIRDGIRPGGTLVPPMLAALGAAVALALMVGPEWGGGYPGRMIYPLSLLFWSGLTLLWAASSRGWLRALILLLCCGLAARDFIRAEHTAPSGATITVENYRRSNAVPLNALAEAAGKDGLVVAIPDVGGTSLFGPAHTIVDTGLLCNRMLARHGYGALYDQLFGSPMVDVIETHGVFTRLSGIREGASLQALTCHFVPVSIGGKVFYLHRSLFERLQLPEAACVPGWEVRGRRGAEALGRRAKALRADLDLAGSFPCVFILRMGGARP
jgi:hypothetical protein